MMCERAGSFWFHVRGDAWGGRSLNTSLMNRVFAYFLFGIDRIGKVNAGRLESVGWSKLTRAAQSFLSKADEHVEAKIAVRGLREVLESPDVEAVLLEGVVNTYICVRQQLVIKRIIYESAVKQRNRTRGDQNEIRSRNNFVRGICKLCRSSW